MDIEASDLTDLDLELQAVDLEEPLEAEAPIAAIHAAQHSSHEVLSKFVLGESTTEAKRDPTLPILMLLYAILGYHALSFVIPRTGVRG